MKRLALWMAVLVGCGLDVPDEATTDEESAVAPGCVLTDPVPAGEQVFGFAHTIASHPYRLSSAATQAQRTLLDATQNIDRYYLLWGNRCAATRPTFDANPGAVTCPPVTYATATWKGNPVDLILPASNTDPTPRGGRIWFYFTTHARAVACTKAQVRALLGEPLPVVPGLSYLRFSSARTWTGLVADNRVRDTWAWWTSSGAGESCRGIAELAGAFGCPNVAEDLYAENTCLVWDQARYPIAGKPPLAERLDGVLLDYEVNDGRDAATTLDLIDDLRTIVHDHDKKLFVFTNALTAPYIRRHGLVPAGPGGPGNLGAILDRVDHLVISDNHTRAMGVSTRANLAAQLAMIQPLPDSHRQRILVAYELDNSLEERDAKMPHARQTRAFIEEEDLGGTLLWRNGADLSPGCRSDVWRSLRCAAYGVCD